jgi:hypothetical protein
MIVPMIALMNLTAMRSNASFGMMSASEALMSGVRNANPNQNMQGLLAMDKKLTADMFNNKVLYMAANAQEDSWTKLRNKNIERTFSTFA